MVGTGMVGGQTGYQISASQDLNGDGIVTGQEASAYNSGVRRVDAVTTGVGQVYTGGMSSGMYGGAVGTGYGQASGLVVRNDTADMDGDGITTANEAARFAQGERRVDMVGGSGFAGGNMVGGSGFAGGMMG